MTHKTDNQEPKFVDTFGCSHIGNERSENGDQFMVAELKRSARVHHASKSQLDDTRRFGANQAHVLLVADGVSGQSGAKRASSLVVDEVMESILNAVPWTPDLDVESEAQLRHELKETVVRCNEQVTDAARTQPEKSDMASTLAMAFVRWPTAFVVHAGDSRAYLIRRGKIERLTTDHTFAQQLVDEGGMDPESAETSRFANVLWNAVGGDDRVKPELTMKTLQRGDTLLLCSDGLTSHLSDEAIRHIVESEDSAERACEELVKMVTGIGGHDDVTVAIARFDHRSEEWARSIEQPHRDDTAGATPAASVRQPIPISETEIGAVRASV